MAEMTSPDKLFARMEDLDLLTPDKTFIGCFYGTSGSGKTTTSAALAQQLTGTGRILHLDSSDGYVSLQNFPGLTSGMTRLRITNYADLYGVATAMEKHHPKFKDFDVVILDEFSSMADGTLDEVVTEKTGDVTSDIDWTYYRSSAQRMIAVLNKLHAIEGLHVIIVAHERKDLLRPKVYVTSPGFSPKFRDSVMQLMHFVGNCSRVVEGSEAKTTYKFMIQAQLSKLVMAKSRIPGIPTYLDPATTIDVIQNWVYSGQIEVDTSSAEEYVDPAEDMLPGEGVTSADLVVEDDDEPALVEPVE
jgi:deoxyadenosine/deoxycytidine kinase